MMMDDSVEGHYYSTVLMGPVRGYYSTVLMGPVRGGWRSAGGGHARHPRVLPRQTHMTALTLLTR